MSPEVQEVEILAHELTLLGELYRRWHLGAGAVCWPQGHGLQLTLTIIAITWHCFEMFHGLSKLRLQRTPV